MATELFSTATEYLWVPIVEVRAPLPVENTTVGLFFSTNPNSIPTVADFTTGILVIPGSEPLGDTPGPKAQTWIALLVGPDSVNNTILPSAGDYQVFSLIVAGPEKIIRRAGVVTLL